MTLSTRIVCASLNYQRLDDRAIGNLKEADLANDPNSLQTFKDSLGFEVDSLAIIKKCNAIMVIISYTDDLSEDYVHGRLLQSWDTFSQGSIIGLKRDIRFYLDFEAIKFLGESSVGIHSVTVGDSQVLSQVSEGLRAHSSTTKSIFEFIADWLGDIAEECRLKTDIFKGNTSLERIASELVIKRINKDSAVALIGYGKSGKLVAKILNQEHGISVVVVNRTQLSPQNEGWGDGLSYAPFVSFVPPANIGAVVVAVDNTPETNILISEIIKKIQNQEVFFVDLSTPPILQGKVKDYCGIQNLSEISQQTIGARKEAAGKARKMIEQQAISIVERINKHSASLYVQKQKNASLSLEKERIDLIRERGEMLQHIRNSLSDKEFVEVITPFIVGISTDPPKVDKGGTIDVDWTSGARAFLRQSNQIYKQICVASGMKKIYEIGPFWRKEVTESYRHLQESIGLDVEMQEPSEVRELYELACTLIKNTNDYLITKFQLSNHLSIPAIKDIPVLTYHEAVDLLRETGHPVTRGDDFGLVSEAKLGQLIRKKYGSDILVIKDYPDTIKKFYTQRKGNGLTETFDIIVDGWELVSGAIRETNGDRIRKSMQLSDINPADYEFYIGIVDGAPIHGGFCLGLDRLLAKILDKELVSEAVPFPRTYKRLIP